MTACQDSQLTAKYSINVAKKFFDYKSKKGRHIKYKDHAEHKKYTQHSVSSHLLQKCVLKSTKKAV